jgi:hypothetical protein
MNGEHFYCPAEHLGTFASVGEGLAALGFVGEATAIHADWDTCIDGHPASVLAISNDSTATYRFYVVTVREHEAGTVALWTPAPECVTSAHDGAAAAARDLADSTLSQWGVLSSVCKLGAMQ